MSSRPELRSASAKARGFAFPFNRSLCDEQAQTNVNTAYGRKAKTEVESILLAN